MKTSQTLPTVGNVAAALEEWAEPCFAESYDNVGLHIGDVTRCVSRGHIALDLTPAVVEEAVRCGASIIITHHPLFFHPLRKMTADDLTGSMALRLAEQRIALYSAHTNLDAAPGGVSCALASLLGVEAPRFLKFNPDRASGMGAIGQLKQPLALQGFLQVIANRLRVRRLRYVGDDLASIHTVAVCGGAGATLIPKAREQGADVYVTADISYHRFFEVLRPDGACAMALVDAGHYETERHAETLLCAMLQERFPHVHWMRTEERTSPIQSFTSVREL